MKDLPECGVAILYSHTRLIPSHTFVAKLINSAASHAIANGNGISLQGISLQLKFVEITQREKCRDNAAGKFVDKAAGKFVEITLQENLSR
jgi:hypothetical protein